MVLALLALQNRLGQCVEAGIGGLRGDSAGLAPASWAEALGDHELTGEGGAIRVVLHFVLVRESRDVPAFRPVEEGRARRRRGLLALLLFVRVPAGAGDLRH